MSPVPAVLPSRRVPESCRKPLPAVIVLPPQLTLAGDEMLQLRARTGSGCIKVGAAAGGGVVSVLELALDTLANLKIGHNIYA